MSEQQFKVGQLVKYKSPQYINISGGLNLGKRKPDGYSNWKTGIFLKEIEWEEFVGWSSVASTLQKNINGDRLPMMKMLTEKRFSPEIYSFSDKKKEIIKDDFIVEKIK